VPYHGWRISHRTHHGNHGHVENDESWHPVTKSMFDKLVILNSVIGMLLESTFRCYCSRACSDSSWSRQLVRWFESRGGNTSSSCKQQQQGVCLHAVHIGRIAVMTSMLTLLPLFASAIVWLLLCCRSTGPSWAA
jgi:hypothetical protein